MMNPERMRTFQDEYTKNLTLAVTQYPEEYFWTKTGTVEGCARLMCAAFATGTFNKDGRAVKATCKALGIKHTYSAIRAYFEGA